jgi:uncharacterized repeat protein (TIGR03847 family)
VARQVNEFDPPERFVAGTVGQPGERTFYLQAREGPRLVSVALEKAQVAVLADRMGQLLDEVSRRGVAVPPLPPTELEDVRPLDGPVEEEFRVGAMALAWDPDAGQVVVEAQAAVPDDESEPGTGLLADDEVDGSDEGGPPLLRVRISPAYARAFIARAERVVAAGRPPCPLCGLPLDPEGHICPRMNGHRH